MNKIFLSLAFMMGLVVLASNYLVQFPIKYYGLEDILTYGAFSYPIAFLITDLANRSFGKIVARKIVYIGFVIGILLTLFVSTNFEDTISIRIAAGSGIAFFVAQNLDVQVFDRLRKKSWFVAPLTSSLFGSIIDTFLFFSIAFYSTGIPWITLAFGDLAVKLLISLVMLIPFRLLLNKIKDYSEKAPSEFPEAEQLLQIRASDTTVMAISLYADNEAMERASAARAKRMSNNEKTFDVVDTKTGEVTLNHKN